MSNQPPYAGYPGPPMGGGMPPMPPKKSGMSGCAIVAIVLAVLLVLVLVLGAAAAVVYLAVESDDDSSASSSPASPTSTSPLPEYGVDATGEVVGEQCRVSGGSGPQRFEVNLKIQNASPDRAYEYTVDVTFTMADSQLGDSYWRQTRTQKITVAAGRSRKVVEHAVADNPGKKYYYGCNITRAVKSSVQ